MKVLHIIPSLNIGGAERLMTELLPRLKEDGYHADLAIMNPIKTSFTQFLEERDIKIIRMKWMGSYYNPLFLFQFFKIIKKYDIIHTHLTAPQFFTAVASFFCHTKLITTEHSNGNRRREKKWFWFIDKKIYERYHIITCVSEASKQNLENYLGIHSSKIRVINNGIDIDVYHSAVPMEGRHPSERTVLLMVGSFRSQKDQDTIIKALTYLPRNQFELWLVGDGPRKNILEKLVKTLNIDDEVVFWGIRSDVPQIIKTADIVIMSSHIESFGLAAVEGMAAGKPVIASNIKGLADVVKDAGVLFEVGKANILANIILQLSTNRPYYDQIARQCFNRANEYDIRIMIKSFENLYSNFYK